MNVSIIGPGAIGILFAVKLSECGINTTLIDYKPDRAKRLAENGLTVESANGTITARPKVALEIPGRQSLIIVATKAHATAGLRLPSGVPVLTIQNGLGNVESLCDLVGSANIIAGTTSEACTYLEEGRVRHVAPGKSFIGAWTSCDVTDAESALTKAGFDVEITDTPGQIIWEKVVISAGINPLTALLGVSNGRLLELPEPRQLIRDLVVEAAKIASTEGYRFSYSLVERTEEICRETSENISSMLQDIRMGRRTEIDAISGEILRRGEMASLPAPRTRVVYQLIKGLERP